MPRTINIQGVPTASVHAFMQAIVDYERSIGAELDEGHIALARSVWMARQDHDCDAIKQTFLNAMADAGIVQLDEGVYRLVPAVPSIKISKYTDADKAERRSPTVTVDLAAIEKTLTDMWGMPGPCQFMPSERANLPPLDGPLRVIASGGGGAVFLVFATYSVWYDRYIGSRPSAEDAC